MADSGKSPDILYSISQVNALTGVAKSTIRFWEKEFSSFLKPSRTTGNQRRYDRDDIEVISSIHRLINFEGYSIEGARRQLQAKSASDEQKNDSIRLDALADTMSDFILKKLFERVRHERELVESGF